MKVYYLNKKYFGLMSLWGKVSESIFVRGFHMELPTCLLGMSALELFQSFCIICSARWVAVVNAVSGHVNA